MPQILIIQSRSRPEMIAAEREEYRRALGTDAHAFFISALDETLAWEEPEKLLAGYDGIIVGGSGEFDFDGGRGKEDPARTISRGIAKRLAPLVRYARESEIPFLGICFGHQIVAEVFGVSVTHDADQKKTGSYPVRLTAAGNADALFEGMPAEFMTQYGHKDSLSALPAGTVVLAEGERCKFSALRYGPRFYTVQFHPELTAADARWKLEHSPGYLPEGITARDIIRESPEASTLIPAFVNRFSSSRS